MAQQLNLSNLIKNEPLARETQALYAFFTEAEASGTHFTYAKIRAHFRRSPSNISKYAHNYWSWFLRREPEKQGRANTFSCHGLKEYPELYFVMAHQRNQGQYYRHFSEALLKGRERDQARRAKLQEASTTDVSSSPSPNVPYQQDPEEIHIEELPPDEEAEEDELETEQPQDQDEETLQEDGNITTLRTETPHKERIDLMSLLTLDKQLKQFRNEIMEELGNMRKSIVNQVCAELAPSIQALGQTLTGEIQGLPVPLADQTFMTRTQALEQALLEQIQPLHAPPDLSPIYAQLVSSVETLEQAIKVDIQGIYSLPALSQILGNVERLQQQMDTVSLSVSQVSPTPARLEQLRGAIDALSSRLSQLSYMPEMFQELREQVSGLSRQIPQSFVPDIIRQLQEHLSQLSEAEQTSRRESVQTLERSLVALEHQYSEITQQLRAFSDLSQISTDLKGIQAKIVQQSSSLSEISAIVNGITSLQKQISDLDWLISRLTPDELEQIYDFIRSGVDTALTLIHTLHNDHADSIQNYFLSVQEDRQRFLEGQEKIQQKAEKVRQILLDKKQILPENVIEQQSLPESSEHQDQE